MFYLIIMHNYIMIQFRMKKIISREIVYFVIILVVLALAMHPDFLHSPLARVEAIYEKGNFLHPLLWTSGLYLIIGFFRIIGKVLNKLKNRYKF